MKKFEMYDVVMAIQDLENVPQGSTGTVLMVFEDGVAYEVEFMDNEGNTLNIITVKDSEIERAPL
jgi:hypothetical protein